MKRAAGILVLATALGAGCASVPMAAPQESARIKMVQPPPNAGLVYLYRRESFGAAIRMTVLVDGVYAGDTAAQTFMVWQLAPGVHTFISKAENDSVLPMSIEPGRRYYIWQEVKMGMWSAGSQLHPVSDAEGMDGVNQCELVQMQGAPH